MELFYKLLSPLIIGILLFGGLLTWGVINSRKQVMKDWGTLEDLEKRSKELKTKEEIEEFHKEFREKAGKIYNQFINPRLHAIDGYLKGIYRQYER